MSSVVDALKRLLVDGDSEDVSLPPAPTAPSMRLPRPLISDPMTQRAVTAVEKRYPNDFQGVNIKPMSWEDPYAGSTVLGQTDVDPLRTGETIEMNPVTTAFPQSLSESVLAHEIEHVRQNRADPSSLHALKQLAIPYRDRPDEIAARKAAEQYDTEQGVNGRTFYADPAVKAALLRVK